MKELPRKFRAFIVAHGPQSLIVLVGSVALVVSGMFLLGNPVFGLSDEPASPATDAQVEVVTSDSVASIKDKDGDNDGLSDLEERLYHTNPANEDTDGDGYTDGQEVENGYDPASKLSAGTEAAPTGQQSSGSLLSLLNSGDTSTTGMGGLGGLSDEQTQQLGDAVLPDGERLADLEVDQILNKGSQPLPSVDRSKVKSTSDSSAEREAEHFNAVAAIAYKHNPFGQGYSIKQYLSDVEGGNRDLFERMKFSAEALLRELQDMTVPESLVDEHAHALAILLASRDTLQHVLDSDVSSDSILGLLGRSFFVMGEFRALLQDAQTELST